MSILHHETKAMLWLLCCQKETTFKV